MLDKFNDQIDEPLARKILFFDELLTPSLIQIAYWLGLVAVVWIGLGDLFSNGFFGIFEALIFMLISAIGLRVLAEIIMLFFKLHENMEILAKNSASTATVAEALDSVDESAESAGRKSMKVGKKTSKKVSKKKTVRKAGKKVAKKS